MSGPSATANPMSAKIAVSSSTTWLIGCTRPVSVGALRTGKVTSTVSVARRASSAAPLKLSRRALSAALTRSLSPLIAGPCTLRSSGESPPSVFSSAVTEPLLPSAETRTDSSAVSSEAAAMALEISVSRAAMSVTARLLWPSWPSGRFRQGCLGLLDDGLEARRFRDLQLRQHLAVDGDVGLGERVDELRIIQPERPHCGVDALNPERAERPLLVLAVAVGVLHRLFHRLLGDADGVAAPAVVALGRLVDLLVLGVRGDAAFDASHD